MQNYWHCTEMGQNWASGYNGVLHKLSQSTKKGLSQHTLFGFVWADKKYHEPGSYPKEYSILDHWFGEGGNQP